MIYFYFVKSAQRMSQEFIIRSRQIVTPQGMRSAAIHVRDGTISAVLAHDENPTNLPVEDEADLVVMPGLVDTHVHINEPGRTAWEGFETATRAAAAGGITTLVDMPLNSSPVTTTVEAFRSKLSAAEGKLWVDCGFYGGVVPGNSRQVLPLIDAGILGFKAFLIHSGIDEFPNSTEADLRSAMPTIALHGLPLLVHCELQTGSNTPVFHHSNPKLYGEYLASRPRPWENDAIALMIRLCRKYDCRTHIVHLSSADAVPMLQDARQEQLPLTVETCPHYLYFTAEEVPEGDTRYKCAPPIRERENQEQLWRALQESIIDMIVSDHSPSTPDLKCLASGDFEKAWGGIPSLQFGLSIIWTEARRRGFTLNDITRWMSIKPAELVNLGTTKGCIAPGSDADFVVWNPNEQFTVVPSIIQHRHKLTPYEGKALYGSVERTYLRGQKIYDRGSFMSKPTGIVLLRK